MTWHYAMVGEPTPVVPDDLDQRAAALLAHHFPTNRVRAGQAGVESECGCGAWYPLGGLSTHLGREASLLARGYFDLALRHARGATQPSA